MEGSIGVNLETGIEAETTEGLFTDLFSYLSYAAQTHLPCE